MFTRIKNIWLAICHCHRSDDETVEGEIVNFFLPKPTRGFFIRLGVIVVASLICFGFLLRPCFISGASMEPTVHRIGATFCWRGAYWFGKKPQRGDIVIIKYTDKVYFLKRVVGYPGETVEFRNGDLYIDGVRQREPYVKFVSDWEMPPRKIEPGHYYVVGDNRSMPINEHKFGQVPAHRIVGKPLW